MLRQDDPKKCTAARLVRLGLARSVRRAGGSGIVLDPFAGRTLMPRDRRLAGAVVGVDCSWRLAGAEFSRDLGPTRRRLPPLLAGNPLNYSKASKLTTAEALAAALFILGFPDRGRALLSRFPWGHTFCELNEGLLAEYSRLTDEAGLAGILSEYGLAGRAGTRRQRPAAPPTRGRPAPPRPPAPRRPPRL